MNILSKMMFLIWRHAFEGEEDGDDSVGEKCDRTIGFLRYVVDGGRE